jgi:hypothetical protein
MGIFATKWAASGALDVYRERKALLRSSFVL